MRVRERTAAALLIYAEAVGAHRAVLQALLAAPLETRVAINARLLDAEQRLAESRDALVREVSSDPDGAGEAECTHAERVLGLATMLHRPS